MGHGGREVTLIPIYNLWRTGIIELVMYLSIDISLDAKLKTWTSQSI